MKTGLLGRLPAHRTPRLVSPVIRRPFSLTPLQRAPISAKDAANRLLDEFSDTTSIRRQTIDGNQLQKLALTLGRPSIGGVDVSELAPPSGTLVPPGYHLIYFTPNGVESDLALDGTDRTFNAPAPFTRRMWAGGKMNWPAAGDVSDSSPLLRVGDEVEEHTKLVSAVAKTSRSAGEMVLVEVDKEIWGPRGLAMVDRRSWIFRPELDPARVVEQPPLPGVNTRSVSEVKDVDGDNGELIDQTCTAVTFYSNRCSRCTSTPIQVVTNRPLPFLGIDIQCP